MHATLHACVHVCVCDVNISFNYGRIFEGMLCHVLPQKCLADILLFTYLCIPRNFVSQSKLIINKVNKSVSICIVTIY